MIPRLAVAICVSLALTSVSQAQGGGGAEAFARLKSLAGNWEGTVEWTGARTETGSMNAAYYVTGNGSALVENLSDGATPAMTSVYHLDGPDLRMTHFCGANNQPRLKANRVDLSRGAIDFEFVDITNLPSADAPHVHGVEIRLVDGENFTLTFVFRSGGQESRERITLKHAGRASSGTADKHAAFRN